MLFSYSPAFQQELLRPSLGRGSDLKWAMQFSASLLFKSRFQPKSVDYHLMLLTGCEATEGMEGPQSEPRLGVTWHFQRGLIWHILFCAELSKKKRSSNSPLESWGTSSSPWSPPCSPLPLLGSPWPSCCSPPCSPPPVLPSWCCWCWWCTPPPPSVSRLHQANIPAHSALKREAIGMDCLSWGGSTTKWGGGWWRRRKKMCWVCHMYIFQNGDWKEAQSITSESKR